MTVDEAQLIVDEYRRSIGQAEPSVYMRYMRAREVLHKGGVMLMTAGQLGFMAATQRQAEK